MKQTGPKSKEEVFQLFASHISPGKVEFFRKTGLNFVFGKRKGPYVWDTEGKKRLIDCYCNGGVFNLGHLNPEIVSTLKESLDELDIGNHHLISKQRALLAARLAELAPGDLPYTAFGVGGGEAVDLAIKIARAYTGRAEIISARGAYHGHTGLALAAGHERYKNPFEPLAPGFTQVPFNNLEELEKAMSEKTAAVIFETVPATLGIAVPHGDFYKGVRALCDKYGAVMIVDEVQSGLGRTGKFWGIEHFGVSPDVLVASKGLSGGIFPMSITSFTGELERAFRQDPFLHVSSFGGAEAGCPVALKVLEITSEPGFLEHVNRLAELFSRGLQHLQERHAHFLAGFRQLGLMIGLETPNEKCGPLLTRTCYENGILSIYAGHDNSINPLLPPLNIDPSTAEEILERLDSALKDAAGFYRESAK